MSPASSGALEVERYIGACLISSSQGRPKHRDQQLVHDAYPGGYVNVRPQQARCAADGWAGGMPLISFMSQRRRRPELLDIRCASPRAEDQQNTLSRLAIHAQGAPLILSGRYNYRKSNKEQRNGGGAPLRQPDCPRNNKFVNRRNVRVSDSISVASDESSGSANSENCLPRIIKPRKRRKKDRKPPHLARADSASLSSAGNSPEIEPYRDEPVYFCDFVNAVDINSARGGELVNRGDDVSYVKGGDPVMHKGEEGPKLHHSFEEVEGSDEASPGDTSSCQCRYCDPSGQIWDVDRRCYSPFLTIPNLNSYHLFAFNAPPSSHECLVDRMSNISLNHELSAPAPKSHLGDLEVSTEIVTSLNGHRDLEIKFFSSTTSAELASRTTTETTTDNVTSSVENRNSTCGNYSDTSPNDVILTVEE